MSRADTVAQQVLDHSWPGTFPVDPAGLARAMGVDVVAESPFEQPSRLNGASGLYVHEYGARPMIVFATGEPPVRQRFTIAHELGHHALGHGTRFRDTTSNFNVYYRDPVEVEANAFAAALLMPSRYVWSEFNAGRANDVARLADTFGVSQVAMLYRLKNLGIVRA